MGSRRDRDDRGRRRLTSRGPQGAPPAPTSQRGYDQRAYDDRGYDQRGYDPRADDRTWGDDRWDGRPQEQPVRRGDLAGATSVLETQEPPRDPREPGRRRRPRRRRSPVRKVLAGIALLLAVWMVATAWAVFDSWRQVGRTEAMPTWEGRPADTAGRNYLLVGSDARENLTREQRARLRTGTTAGRRTDSIMLVHVPTFGTPTLVSIPRDSYVPIRGMGMNKINASYNAGGAPLLIDTVEQNTGLRIDGYTEIGFGGFADVVDSLGGVEICPKTDIVDRNAHLNIKAGCQTMNGKTALGFVRARYFDPRGDLGRVERQREFLKAISKQVMTPSTLLLPWNLHKVGTSTTPALTVDEHDSMLEIASALNGVRVASGGDNQVTVPISDSTLPTDHGWAVAWDKERSDALWKALREGDPIPTER